MACGNAHPSVAKGQVVALTLPPSYQPLGPVRKTQALLAALPFMTYGAARLTGLGGGMC